MQPHHVYLCLCHCLYFVEIAETLQLLFFQKPLDVNAQANVNYLKGIIGHHGLPIVQNQVKVINSNNIWMQVQGFSSFCGLCALNNALCLNIDSIPFFSINDLDLASDNMRLRQLSVESPCSQTVEPLRI